MKTGIACKAGQRPRSRFLTVSLTASVSERTLLPMAGSVAPQIFG